jgi:hypothetical protein
MEWLEANMRTKDTESEILKLGWDTESTSSGKRRAVRGPKQTGWHDNWEAVMKEVTEQCKP